MSRFWDWLTGQERERQAAAELARQHAREAQDRALDRAAMETARKQPEAIQRLENELRPGERWLREHTERQRQMHDHPPEPDKKPDLVVQREATRLEYTMTPQPAPTLGGPGLPFVNKRAAGPSIAKKLLDAGQAHRDAQPQPDKQPDLRLDIDAVRTPGSNPLFPDYSKGLQLKPPSGRTPGEDDQQ